MYETLRYSEAGDVGTLELIRPRINVRQIRELEKLCDHLEDQSTVQLLLLRGHSEGIDFGDFDPKEALDIHGFNKWEKLVHRFESLEKLTMAALDGPCHGGGLQLALAFDVRICSPDATFALPEIKLGFLPGMSTWRLGKFIGLGRARRLALTGERLAAAEAERLGLVDQVAENLDQSVAHWLQLLRPYQPVAAALSRRLMLEAYETPFEDAIGNFLAAQHRAISQSAFLETLKKERKPS
ncbi:MAG TPA: enoyl-CoA hydratase/isomerase family protein [Myxococcota bacterium]|nr:enoyl-CoA hydratase/isomerase family protein [Myxococcota bacterium]HND29105.1 enoyl-CoA hydratase/isomerase family protein [Myxococcota bacterium]